MNVDITSPSAPAFSPTSTVSSALPINKVPVITQPPPTNTSLDSSIHAHPLPVSTNPSPNDKDKSVAFDIPERRPSPDEADLLEIATQVNAKALNVLLSINSYKPKPYVYLNFSSFDTLEAAKELSVAFRVDDRLNKLYSRFNAGPRRGHQDSRQSRDKSTSHSRSRSTSRSRNNSSSSRSNNNNNNNNTSRPNVLNRNNQSSTNYTNSRNNANSSGSTQPSHTFHPNNTTSTSPNNNPNCTLPQHIIDELKAQIEKIAHTLNTLEETVSWMNDTITAHDSRS
ncbi:hypothetical protein GLOIN_2v1785090 [Rhizophagus irregularis DAOM 181602=DAOM 197198]|nr:hypothetical protein GLOIN_2v1785090 [Rhizophagus irregularis DAOM 181602=DAOM 197198]